MADRREIWFSAREFFSSKDKPATESSTEEATIKPSDLHLRELAMSFSVGKFGRNTTETLTAAGLILKFLQTGES